MGNVPSSDRRSRYYFAVHGGDWQDDDSEGTLLASEIEAAAYARRVIRELKEAGGYDEPNLSMVVKDHTGRIIFSFRF
jgi:Domain of unknown function (DUF6894)